MQTTVRQTASRLVIQSALQRYYNQSATYDPATNFDRSEDDFRAVFTGDGDARLAVQTRMYPRNDSGTILVSVSADSMQGVRLPYTDPSGNAVFFGDVPYGYPPSLYPNFTTFERSATANGRTGNQRFATYNGREINSANYLLNGPFEVNNSLSLISITLPIINNTSNIDTMAWLTVVLDAGLLTRVVNALEGLDDSGLTMVIGPENSTNKFPRGVLDAEDMADQQVNMVVPPTNRSVASRHQRFGTPSNLSSFDWNTFPIIKKGFSETNENDKIAGSAVSTKNEEGRNVAVGYASVNNPMVDWLVLVEQTHDEVWAPINRLRNVILACVFGTMGAMLILAFPVAHYSSRPIRRLRDATKKSVSPHLFEDDSVSSQQDGFNDHDEALARKEGFFGSIVHYRRNQKISKAEKREAQRRRQFRIPSKVKDRKHLIHDELTDLTKTFNEMTDELMMQYEKLEERVQQRTAELEQSKKAAEAANESKTLFIANISHELKTPLNGILGMCAVCMSEDDPIKLRRSLGIIYKSGDLLLNLLTDLLTFSKNQVGQHLSLDEKDFRLREICTQVLAIFDKQAKEGEINLNVKFEGPYDANLDANGRPNERGDLGPFGLGRVKDMVLYGDQHRILQVIINLVSNSLKFTPKGGHVTISIRCLGGSYMTDSRKASLQSRNSSLRGSRARARASGSEIGSISVATHDRYDTANVINPHDKGSLAHMTALERAATPPPGRWLDFEFEVEDTGPGIPATLHDKIFEPFVQGDLGLSKKYGGTGLGLSICSQLAGLMKGTITLKSEIGQGSVFTMAIPLKHLTSRADSTASSSNVNLMNNSARASLNLDETIAAPRTEEVPVHHVASQPAPPSGAGPVAFESDSKPRLVGLSQPFFASNAPLESPNSQTAAMKRVEAEAAQRGIKVRVLVAEDNKTNQEVVLRMLKLEDVYDVTVAKDGQEALDRVKESMENQKPYNLIFMDVQMPNLDGLQSTRLIRESGFSAPIVALTAYAEESNIKECYNSGMDFFLSKPIRRPALKHVLKTYCAPIPEEDGEATPPAAGSPALAQPDTSSPPKASASPKKKAQSNDEAVSPFSHPGEPST